MFNRIALLAFPLLAAITASASPPATQPSRADLEKKFGETMSGATMAGSYTVNGSTKPPGEDQYTLGAVTHTQGDNWIFTASIKYGARSISLPIELPVKWAGDTAVITVDHVGFPGLGSYNARVMIVGDDYVGVWGSADGSHGGKMWGHVEHPTTQPAK